MFKKLLAVLVGATLVSAALAESENLLPVPGDKYVGLGGQWMNVNSTDMINLAVKLDYTVQPQFGVAAHMLYLRVDDEDAWGLTLVGKLLLAKEGATLPYLQAGGIYYDGQGENDATYVLGAGVDHYISATQAFYVDFITFKPDAADDWINLVTIGFKMKF